MPRSYKPIFPVKKRRKNKRNQKQCDCLKIVATLEKLMLTVQDLTKAANTLSTAADTLSLKTDTLVTAIDRAVEVLSTQNLNADGEAAVAALEAASTHAAAAGDKVDSEVAKLDAILPTPAPAGAA